MAYLKISFVKAQFTNANWHGPLPRFALQLCRYVAFPRASANIREILQLQFSFPMIEHYTIKFGPAVSQKELEKALGANPGTGRTYC
jgi:hypothetical protein